MDSNLELKEMGKRFSYALKKAGYSKSELAKKLGISKSSLTDYEKGESDPRSTIAQKIASALDVDLNWLISGVESNPFYDHVTLTETEKWIVENMKRSNPQKVETLKKMFELLDGHSE